MKEIKCVNESYITSQAIIIIEIFNSVDFKSTTCSNYLRPSQNFWFLMEERQSISKTKYSSFCPSITKDYSLVDILILNVSSGCNELSEESSKYNFLWFMV